ncbi:hypothetical protein [Actinoplanes teichomyceticus]|uniref:hypothetical protein n=1 Tax=Actinoplanes teichomyceticus TaxID=1867 RepID=UPI000F09BC1D|nr:hypothetical protein [Actinoplanes teichomyceticus]
MPEFGELCELWEPVEHRLDLGVGLLVSHAARSDHRADQSVGRDDLRLQVVPWHQFSSMLGVRARAGLAVRGGTGTAAAS